MTQEIRVLAPTAMLGAGYLESSFERGLSLNPHVIACDSGSTDGGPHALGGGGGTFTVKSIERDLRIMLKGRQRLGIPLIIGSCGTSGSDIGVDRVRDAALRIAAEEGLSFRLAVIRSEQDREYLKVKLGEQKIRPLTANAPKISDEVIDRSTHIVGMMGPEPIIEALEQGADVILAGRASDTAVFSAYPLWKGANPGPVWHSAKIMECGASASVNRKRPDSMFSWIRDDHFDIEPMDPENRVSPQSVASHSLYENTDPYLLREPSGTINVLNAKYEQFNDRIVRVSGSAFDHAEEYTIKLEGAERAGHQHVIIGGVRDPYIIRQLDPWLEAIKDRMKQRVVELFDGKVQEGDYDIHCRIYGRSGTMGAAEPLGDAPLPHDVGLVFTVTAEDSDTCASLAKSFAHLASHYPIPEWSGLITGIGFPYSPFSIDRGTAYRFNMNHVVTPASPTEMFKTQFVEVGA